MEHIVVITAVGHDQPGIIAALTGAVYELGGNLDDATMTRLHGTFATMLSVRLPESQTVGGVREALEPVAERQGLTIAIQTVPDAQTETPPDCLLTVYGADKPGIVYAITKRLAERGVNITDMDTRVAGTDESPVYVMLLEAVSGDVDLANDLDELRSELGVDITFQPLDAEAL